jgi:polar amino acid transport system permease protein
MKKLLSFIAAVAIYIGIFYFVLIRTGLEPKFDTFVPYYRFIFRGWFNTISLGVVSISLALVFGLVLYFIQESKNLVLKYFAEILKTMAFATPLLVIAITSYYYIGNAFKVDNKFVVGSITLGIYISAYIADIYKAAIESIHVNQWQAAKMFGFNKFQTYRYIIFPQVVRSILPPLAGQFALTIKGTSLLSYMATAELFNTVNQVAANSLNYTAGFIIMTVGYWIITIPLIFMVRKLETKANYAV